MKHRDLLEESKALLEGHFLLSSGKHSNGYVQCAKLLMYPNKANIMIKTIVDQVKDLEIDLVVGPAMGGIIVAYELARQLGVPAIFTEREQDVMTLRRGFEIPEGAKVLISEDVVTTGKSSGEAIEVVKEHGGEIVGIAALIDRRTRELDYPLFAATKVDIATYDPEDCPLCNEGIPLVKPGSRKKFN